MPKVINFNIKASNKHSIEFIPHEVLKALLNGKLAMRSCETTLFFPSYYFTPTALVSYQESQQAPFFHRHAGVSVCKIKIRHFEILIHKCNAHRRFHCVITNTSPASTVPHNYPQKCRTNQVERGVTKVCLYLDGVHEKNSHGIFFIVT